MKLDGIRKLIEASTPGPWYASIDDHHVYDYNPREDIEKDKAWTVGPLADEANWNTDCNMDGYGMPLADAKLAAASRTLLPKLLYVVETAKRFVDLRNSDCPHCKYLDAETEFESALTALEAE